MHKPSIDNIQVILKDKYGLNALITPLAGEVDYNYKVEAEGGLFLLKICRPSTKDSIVDFQVSLLDHINTKELPFDVPQVIRTLGGDLFFLATIDNTEYFVRLHTWVSGYMLDVISPRTQPLYQSWGETCCHLSVALTGYDHPAAHRMDKWNPVECHLSRENIRFISDGKKKALAESYFEFCIGKMQYAKCNLRSSVNYSDAHEHNLLLRQGYQRISGVIDFGDAIFAPTICELGIACAYAGMHVNDPLEAMGSVISGYHSVFPILEEEIDYLLPIICARLLITVTNAAKSAQQEPDNEYLQISADPAWRLLERLKTININFITYYFRNACRYEPCPDRVAWNQWRENYPNSMILPINVEKHRVGYLDLSVGSTELGGSFHFDSVSAFSKRINDIFYERDITLGVGGYCEVRPFYTTDAYQVEGNNGPRWRTMHLGTDYWTDAGEDVRVVYDGVVHSIKNNDNPCDYGPTIILRHQVGEVTFYSLYGHLSISSLGMVEIGAHVQKGDKIAEIGAMEVNGGWPPHLHFQLVLDLLEMEGDFPGVCFVSECSVWRSLCPDIDGNGPDREKSLSITSDQILRDRHEVLGENLSVSYDLPLHMVRGDGQYLLDTAGRRYLDTVNNVAHVGHEHPYVVRSAQRQMELLNTNTRYLHENITEYACRLASLCPQGLDVVFLVNSGSEANELALRMAKVYTRQNDVIALKAGYHGNTGNTVGVSSYKFDGNGGAGAPLHTSIVPIPDVYRGRVPDGQRAGEYYSNFIRESIKSIQNDGRDIACMIVESILSCGGQIELPEDYLRLAFEHVRATGGICIADEVQVGFGRVGTDFWGFESQGVVPDILTCGKPIGNGHPLGAVITSRAVADAFANGMEYFNTYGGNPVSCAVGVAVLKTIENENLQKNAHSTGDYLKSKLIELMDQYKIIGDVRGRGFFLGIELVRDRNTLEPADTEADYLANRMRELGILMSTDGPLQNVIKIKPPMCFNKANADELISKLNIVFQEIDCLTKIGAL